MRFDRLAENASIQVLLDAERYLEERKAEDQLVGSDNVVTGVYGPVSATYTLDQPSPQSPSTGMAFTPLSFHPNFMNDAFCRVIARQIVGGVWYRPSDRLIDIKNGVTPHDMQIYRMIVGASDSRNVRNYQIVLSGPLNSTVTVEAWVVSIGAATT